MNKLTPTSNIYVINGKYCYIKADVLPITFTIRKHELGHWPYIAFSFYCIGVCLNTGYDLFFYSI